MAAAALLGFTLVAWAAGLAGGFQYDDLPNIVLDPATAGGEALRERLANGFRPLLRLSYVADHALWGFDGAGFLSTNLALHAATVLAVWRLALRRLADPLAAFLAAVLFALQPAHAAVVSFASGRSTGLMTLGLVLALLAHEHAWREDIGRTRRVAFGALSLIAFALAVTAKEVALVYPLLLAVWEGTRPGASADRVARRVGGPALAALAGTALAWTLGPRLRELAGYSLALADPLDALARHAAALPLSLALWARPWALSVEHPAPGAGAVLPGALALAGLLIAALALRRHRPLATLALLWPLAMLAPTHTLIARLDWVVEKPLYPAWIGPALALGAALAAWLRRSGLRHAGGAGLGLVLLVALTATCAWRAATWADPAALWREATERAPLSARAWHNRALAESAAGRDREARRSVGIALALDADAPRTQALALALAISLAADGAPPPSSLPSSSPLLPFRSPSP